MLSAMLRQYPEFLLFSVRETDGPLKNIFLSRALSDLGLSVETMHAAYSGGALRIDSLTADRPIIVRLNLSAKLPTFTLAVRGLPSSGAAPPAEGPVLIAEFPLNRLYTAGGESKLSEIYVTDASGVPLVSVTEGREDAVGAGAAGSFADLLPKTAQTAGTREYAASGVPMLAAYA